MEERKSAGQGVAHASDTLPLSAPIDGTEGSDTLYGTEDSDVIQGLGGDDYLRGLNGGDRILGGDGEDDLYGDKGRDRLWGEDGDDTLEGANGDDVLKGGEGNDSLRDDVVFRNRLRAGDDVMMGEEGRDTLISLGGRDYVSGGDGDDLLLREGGDATLLGGDGDDFIDFYDLHLPTSLVIDGGRQDPGGADRLSVTVVSADGPLVFDLAACSAGVVQALAGGVTVVGLEQVSFSINSVYDDSFTGYHFQDVVGGGEGDDTLHGGGGDDYLRGGTGAHDVVCGDDGNDHLSTNGGGEVYGGDGHDELRAARFEPGTTVGLDGGQGEDTLIAGDGRDRLRGGEGADRFVYLYKRDAADGGGHKSDIISDLEDIDTIDLSKIDADASQDGDQAFHLVSAFSGAEGELRLWFDVARGITLLEGDIDGDGQANFLIRLKGDHEDFTGFEL